MACAADKSSFDMRKPSNLYYFFPILIIALLLTFNRNTIYLREEDFWRDVTIANPQKGRAFNALGWYYYSKGDFQSAISNYSEAIQRHPYYAQLYIDLAKAHEAAGDIQKAIETVKYSLFISDREGTSQPGHHTYLGTLYFKELHLQEALQEFTTALKTEPGNATLYYKIGLVYRAQGNIDEAITFLDDALKLTPQDSIIKEEREVLLNSQALRTKQRK